MTGTTLHEPVGRHQSKVAAASGWIGSALEYYDFFIYATAASLVFPQEFFPSTNPTSLSSLHSPPMASATSPGLLAPLSSVTWATRTGARTCCLSV